MSYLYTLAFIKRGKEILMMNRVKDPWMGMWNGVGGKRSADENPLDCIVREVIEETGIIVTKSMVKDKGIVTWNDDFKAFSNGLHLFFVELPDDFNFDTPKPTDEGILDWKQPEWLLDKRNLGVSYNIPYFLNNVLYDDQKYHYHCIFKGNDLIKVEVEKI
ncbi:8-oxo-dGTP diphosphatase [Acholeplasma equirhinis]|uniref:NUDIX hydrolase n=1 Tax=Acholeplasma equirhinis TaxID=555393 RepID=UPI00197A7E18|nr:8-oxo-dGTP diphosphatase [Acholeplasma equirhinis]MBN3490522.1 8-oxo-dGTP diphosphatase [Acholeplasma equirhinis]